MSRTDKDRALELINYKLDKAIITKPTKVELLNSINLAKFSSLLVRDRQWLEGYLQGRLYSLTTEYIYPVYFIEDVEGSKVVSLSTNPSLFAKDGSKLFTTEEYVKYSVYEGIYDQHVKAWDVFTHDKLKHVWVDTSKTLTGDIWF